MTSNLLPHLDSYLKVYWSFIMQQFIAFLDRCLRILAQLVILDKYPKLDTIHSRAIHYIKMVYFVLIFSRYWESRHIYTYVGLGHFIHHGIDTV